MDRIVRAVLEGDEADPGRVPAVDVARLVLGVQTPLSGVQFQRHRTVAELAAEQGVRGPQDLDLLHSQSLDRDELAAFVTAAEQL
jgi:hypothetical protein